MFSFDSLFREFMPHGHCYAWDPLILTLSVVSDGIIALSYFSIPIALVYLVKKRKDLVFHKIFILFATFILACGMTHVIEIWNVWHGYYGLASVVKFITAIASIATAFALFNLIPKAINLPSTAELDMLNQQLTKEVGARKVAQEEILRFNQDLEKRAAQSIKGEHEALEQFSVLAENIPQLVWISRPDGHSEYFNRRWAEYSGDVAREQASGKGWTHLLHPDDLEKMKKRWNESLKTGEAYEIEYRLRRGDGQYRWFLARAAPLKNERKEITRWFGTCTDINDQKI